MNQWPSERCWCRPGNEDDSDGRPGGWQVGPEKRRLGTHKPQSTPAQSVLPPPTRGYAHLPDVTGRGNGIRSPSGSNTMEIIV